MSWVVKTLGRMLTKPTVNFRLSGSLFRDVNMVTVHSNHVSCQPNVLGTDVMVHKLSFTRFKSEVRTSR